MRLSFGSWVHGLLRNLGWQSSSMAAAAARLGSGLRVQRAGDDPAGLAIGTRLRVQAAGTRVALRNISAGLSLLATADGALGQVAGLLQRAREVAVAAANGTLTAADRTQLQQEILEIRAGINDLAVQTTFNGRRVFGDYGFGYSEVFSDPFTDLARVATLTNTVWENGRLTLSYTARSLFADSFDDTSMVDVARTTAFVNAALGRVTSPRALAAAVSDTFATLARVDPGLTTALVDTVAGLVRLSQAATLRGSATFNSLAGTDLARTTAIVDTGGGYVTQAVNSQALFGDTFADLAGVNPLMTTAQVDTAAGTAALPADWAAALAGRPGWQLGRVLNQRFFDTFTSLSGTDAAASTALVDTGAGLVTAPDVAAVLWNEAPAFTLPGAPPGWIAGGADTFDSLAQISSSTGLAFDTVAGVVHLLAEAFTVAADSFADASRVDAARTTAVVDTAAGQVYLPSSLVTESYGDSFATTSQVLSSSGIAIDTAAGTAALSAGLASVKADTFADGSGVGAGSTGVVVSGGELRLDQVARLNDKAAGGAAVFNPGAGPNGAFDSGGLLSTSVVDAGGGRLRMYYVTLRNNGAGPAIGYTESADGGLTWSAGTSLSLANVTTSSELFVTRDAAGTYHLFYRSGNSILHSTSATGTGGWSAPVTAVSRGGYSAIGRPTIVQDAAGTYHMFYEVTSGTTRQIEHATATSLDGPWTDLAGWTNITGAAPEIVHEGNRYSLYYRNEATGEIVRSTSTDLTAFSAATAVVTKSASGFDRNAVRVGGAVYDAATGVTRMLYLGRATGNGEWAAGLAYTTARTSGTFVSTVTSTADTLTQLQLTATASLTGGTITYEVSADGGTTWQAVTSGGTVSVAPGRQLLLRATLTNTAGINGGGVSLQEYALHASLYSPAGQVTSTAYTFSRPVDHLTLNATATTPAGTAITYEYSIDGGATWQAMAPGARVSLGTAVSRVQVRASLSTADRGFTPVLQDYTLAADYRQYDASAYLYTQNYTFADRIDRFELAATQTGSVAWEYSVDGGATWQAAAPGTNALAGPVQQLQLRARLEAGGGGATTPVISDYAVTAARYQASGRFTATDIAFARPVNELRLNATASLPAGTGITYEVSADGGATWQAIVPGGTLALASAVTSVRLRATLATTDRYDTPTLSDYTLEGLTTGYAATATYTSAVHSFGYDVQNVTLKVTESKPAGTAIAYELSTDGGTTWQAVTPGASVAVTPGQNLVLRAHLSTTDPAQTPQLVSYTLETTRKQSRSVWQSAVTAPGAPAGAVRLTAAESLPAGTGITYEVSADGGANWTAVTPGAITSLGAPGSQLAVRATLATTDPYAAPGLLDLTLETYDYEASRTFTSPFQTLAVPTAQVRLDSVAATVPAGTGVSYQVTNDGGATWQAVSPGGVATFAAAGSQVGFRAVLTSDGSATPDLAGFSLSVPGYASGKYVYSTVRSYGFEVGNITLTATEEKPAGTDILYEVSTDGGVNWTAVTPGSNALVPAGRDLVFRAFLLSSNPGVTPVLHDYALSTLQPAAGSEWVSTAISTGADVSQVRLTVSENKPAGTDIAYFLSTDGGATFQPIAPGRFAAVTPGSSLVLKAAFSSASPGARVAQLLDYQLETLDYSGPQVFTSTVADIGHDVTEARLDVEQSLPAGTGITYELSNDGGATWVAATPGLTATFAAPGRQLAMRATLTGTSTATPALTGYTLSAPLFTSGVLYATAQDLAAPLYSVVLNATSVTPAGTGILYEVSADGGGTWQAVTPGVETALRNPGSRLVVRATLNSSDGRSTAELLDWSVETRSYSPGGSFTSVPVLLPAAVSKLKLTADYLPGGGAIGFELSNDGGSTWVPASPGNEVTFAGPGAQVLVRATLTGAEGAAAPQLLGYALAVPGHLTAVPGQFTLQTGIQAGVVQEFSFPWITTAALGLESLDVSTGAGATAALGSLDAALQAVGRYRAQVGAAMNALEFQFSRATRSEEILSAAAGRLLDADMARETLDLARAQITFRAAAGILSTGLDGRRQILTALLGGLPVPGGGPGAGGAGSGPAALAPGRGGAPGREGFGITARWRNALE